MDLRKIADRWDASRAGTGLLSTMLASEGPQPPGGGMNDVMLLEMVAAWARNAAAVDRADKAQFDAEDQCRWPKVPEALFCRPSDHRVIRRYSHRHHSGRDWYGHGSVLDDFRRFLVESPFGRSDNPRECHMHDRINEIIDAAAVFDDAREAARIAGGLDRAEARARRLHERNRLLRRQIAETEAQSIAGALAKVKLVSWCYRADFSEMAGILSDMLEREGPTAETIAYGIVVDLVRLLDGIEVVQDVRAPSTVTQPDVH